MSNYSTESCVLHIKTLSQQQFDLWNKAGGRVLPGLVRRRAAERALFEACP